MAGLADVLRPGQVGAACLPQHVGDHHRVGNGVVHAQRPQGIDNLDDVLLVFEDHFERLEHRGLGHQPEAHLGGDAINNLPVMLSFSAPSAIAGPVGNTMDRGVGYTPYGEHFMMQCGMEVVLAESHRHEYR
ncbi:hypothetical protein CF98_01540 [Halopseudomonas bauzanensis]|nr:hypothetical protein CF98_01540 [Halopseudomonas bauzanensis]